MEAGCSRINRIIYFRCFHLTQLLFMWKACNHTLRLLQISERSKSPDTQQMKLVSAIGIRNFPLLVHFSLNSFALSTSSPPTQQSCRPHKNLKHDSQTDLPHIDVLFICKKKENPTHHHSAKSQVKSSNKRALSCSDIPVLGENSWD